MKIQSLHFKNLNSLYGEWKIDFTHEEYLQSGIFALTGPTGSGKSTILDAICLALYGYTPRLGNITKSSNEIMSRHTGECFSEIKFLVKDVEYSCRWEQRRAKKKASGALQNPTYEMSNLSSGKILASNRTDVLHCVEEKTGMNFERFTRTILLSQGKFDAFLQAKVEEKSSMLEEITGTEIYTKISLHVHEKLREKKENLAHIQAQNAHITILSEEEISSIQNNIQEVSTQVEQLQKEKNTLQNQKEWLLTIENLESELDEILKNKEGHQQKLHDFTPQKERLVRAKKASELDFLYAELSSLRKEQNKDLEQITIQEKLEPEAQKLLQTNTNEKNLQEQNILSIKAEIQKYTPLFKEIRILDHNISQQNEAIKSKQKLLHEEKQKLFTLQEQQKAQVLKKENTTRKLQNLNTWQKENKYDSHLITHYNALSEQLNQLNLLLKEGLQERKPEKETKEKMEKLEKEFKVLEETQKQEHKEFEYLNTQKKSTQEEITKQLASQTLKDYQKERDYLLREKSLITRIVSLEEERKNLIYNIPCPLCGATTHPFTAGNIPQISPIESQIKTLDARIMAITEAEKNLQCTEKKLHKLTIQMLHSKNTLEKNKDTKKKLQEEHNKQIENIQKCLDNFYAKNKEIVKALLPFQLKNISEESILNQNNIEVVDQELQNRLYVWQEKEKQKHKLEQELNTIMLELATQEALLKSHMEKQTIEEQNINLDEKQIIAQKIERQKKFADKDPDKEENNFQKSLSKVEQLLLKTRQEQEENTKKLHTIQARCQALREQCASRLPILEAKEEHFQQALIENGFHLSYKNAEPTTTFETENYTKNTPEQNYLKACLTSLERAKIEKELLELEETVKTLHIQQNDRQTKLKQEMDKKLYPNYFFDNKHENPTQNLSTHINALMEKLLQNSVRLKEFTEKNIELSQSLKRNEEAKKHVAQTQERINLSKNEVSRIEKLHTLIGSSDGKKFRNFAQGLTFELLINHANKQLATMSDRYLLQHDQSAPLRLNVIDYYQGGEIRTTNNLSGGECFIVSLALALGLSQMVSQKVRVDSLFLDEGFGTLDEEALETALETLTKLTYNSYKQQGDNTKLIGIISHISALKERIPLQIQLLPQNAGKSILQGIGCQEITSKIVK